MNKILLVVFVSLLIGCGEQTKEFHLNQLPEGLKDCKFYDIIYDDWKTMKIVRCPNSATSTEYPQGKVKGHTITIDET